MTLAELTQADLDPATLAALFDDLERHAEVLDAYLKGAATVATAAADTPLRAAQAALQTGQARGVQIRYRWGGEEWRDTLIRTDAGVRLVRARMP